jgi:Acetyltransferase (GNAT) domain
MRVQVIDSTNPLWSQTLQKLRHDIYHLPKYATLEAERVKATPEAILIVEDEKTFFVPYLLRSCSDIFNGEQGTQDVFDVVSPYGYPGILLSESAVNISEFLQLAMAQLIAVLRVRGVCSVFLRLHPILNHELSKVLPPSICKVSGETVSIDLKLSATEIWHQTRSEHRNKINRLKRSGLTASMVRLEDHIDDFIGLYRETMLRVGASLLYFFDYNYFLQLANLGKNLHLCLVEWENQLTCAGIFTECDGIVQYHLGGTKNEFLKQAPSKLMFDYVRFWAKERGNEFLHLGGGVGGSKDSLFHFKAGFSKQRHTFHTLQLIIDEEKYQFLANLRAKSLNIQAIDLIESQFFPAYRASA